MSDASLLPLIAALTDTASRRAAARALAQAVGAEDLLIFLPDPEVELFLPAPGFAQTLPRAAEWHRFLARCEPQSTATGVVAFPNDSSEVTALGLTDPSGAVLVLLGGEPAIERAREIALLLPLLAVALGVERLERAAEGQASLARQAARQSTLLTSTLDGARQSLQKALAAAEAANRAKDEFLAALSHELRTPLSPVLMTATAMELDSDLNSETREQAAMIRRNVELEVRLIDDLLDLTRITHGKLKLITGVVDIHELLAQTAEIIASESRGKRVEVRFNCDAKKHHVHGDAGRLQQVFWNVVKNAVKFTPANGHVRIATRNPAEGRMSIEVTDTGVGIAPEVLPHIFKAFEQGTAGNQHRFGGLGLGLAIASAIVKMHGGTIRGESAGGGRGATFVIELQNVRAPSNEPTQAAPAQAPSARKLRLLLVEDHDSTRDVLARILGRAGHEVQVARNGAQAIALARTEGHFDAVISDIGLPDQSGFDLMRVLKAEHQLPGIALSGYGMEEDIRKAKAAGFGAHLVKPISFDRLSALLEQVANGALI